MLHEEAHDVGPGKCYGMAESSLLDRSFRRKLFGIDRHSDDSEAKEVAKVCANSFRPVMGKNKQAEIEGLRKENKHSYQIPEQISGSDRISDCGRHGETDTSVFAHAETRLAVKKQFEDQHIPAIASHLFSTRINTK